MSDPHFGYPQMATLLFKRAYDDYLETQCFKAMLAGKDLAVAPLQFGVDPAQPVDHMSVTFPLPETRLIEPQEVEIGELVEGGYNCGTVYHTAKSGAKLRKLLLEDGWTPPSRQPGDISPFEAQLFAKKALDICQVVNEMPDLRRRLGLKLGEDILDGLLAWLKGQANE